ncbi:hypothetical protein H7K45_22425 [Mycobacterium yunnanensis]|uniref:Uncharacterized protein n=1 Tax=Mycobacterium yunnanensis TaxID=368477 RepID=A0A9X2YPZ1_9MYCO|nr:hypothetical protein [Mycobacterium yunnanensis]
MFHTTVVVALLGWGGLITGVAPALADPPTCPPGAVVVDDGCSARFSVLSADDVNGTLTGTPAGGNAPITVFGEPQLYLPSTGFGGSPPGAVQQWDATIQRVGAADPGDPNWYGRAKANAFLPRQLNQLATQMPANTLVIRFVPDGTDPHISRLSSIQPVG